MLHFYKCKAAHTGKYENKEVDGMLRLSVTKNEYLMIGKDVRLTFLGSNDKSLKIMIDAPKDINIARGKAIEKRAREKEVAADRDWFD